MKRCYSCFNEYGDAFTICPHCGQIEIKSPVEAIHLYPGTVLANRYIIGTAVGAGGFGIVYKAWDAKLEAVVAVKEFFVSRIMTRAEGVSKVIVSKKAQTEFEYRKERFLAEARNMAKFGAHRSIPNVFEFFEENNTAYIVMELLKGAALNEYLHDNGGKLDIDLAIFIANEVGNALKSLHAHNIIHRDVAPDNIYVCTGREIRFKLMDLGAAKLADSTDDVIDIILKPGYSPVEQYDNGKNIGTWSDIYALGATLYIMLTGVKPEESTNRKIKDNVVPPRELNPEISENLSNTIMKAMAIDKHMRFKTVEEFLSALNGERKVITLARERKKRRRKRFLGITAALLALSVVAGVVIHAYSSKKADQYLDDAKITLWFAISETEIGSDGGSEEKAILSVTEHFNETFPNVEIEVTAIPESEYAEKIAQAAAEGNLPTLFESTDVSNEVLEKAHDLEKVIKSEQFKDCLFLNQYDDYYTDEKRMPLAIEVPVAYIIKRGNTVCEYNGEFFGNVSDLGEGLNISADSNYSQLVYRNFGGGFASESEFYLEGGNTSPVLLSSTMAMEDVRNLKLTEGYAIGYVYMDSKEIQCNFVYEWSIGNGDESQIRAAERLLSWMLGNVYQSSLMISECAEDNWMIPVNKTSLESKLNARGNCILPLGDIYKKFKFERED